MLIIHPTLHTSDMYLLIKGDFVNNIILLFSENDSMCDSSQALLTTRKEQVVSVGGSDTVSPGEESGSQEHLLTLFKINKRNI